mgnify:CR=1 FL=1
MAEIISNQFTSTINKGSGEPPNLKGSKSCCRIKILIINRLKLEVIT